MRLYLHSALELVASGDGGLKIEFVNGEVKVPHLHLKEARLKVEEALGTCLLPSLQLVPANPAVGQEIWEVMSLLPYEVGTSSTYAWRSLFYFIFLIGNDFSCFYAIYAIRCGIVCMVNGKKKMNGCLSFWQQGKRQRSNNAQIYSLRIFNICSCLS